MGQKNKYFTSGEFGHLLGVNAGTVVKWTNKKKLICSKTSGGHRRYSIEEVERVINNYYANSNGVWQ